MQIVLIEREMKDKEEALNAANTMFRGLSN